jgi:hypothetical protein
MAAVSRRSRRRLAGRQLSALRLRRLRLLAHPVWLVSLMCRHTSGAPSLKE